MKLQINFWPEANECKNCIKAIPIKGQMPIQDIPLHVNKLIDYPEGTYKCTIGIKLDKIDQKCFYKTIKRERFLANDPIDW